MAIIKTPPEQSSSALLMRQNHSSANCEEQIIYALARMVVMRGGEATEIWLELLKERLLRENFEDVMRACRQLEELPRRDGQNANPDLGTILDWIHKRGVYEPGELKNSEFKTIAQLAEENGADPNFMPEMPANLRRKTKAEELEEQGW